MDLKRPFLALRESIAGEPGLLRLTSFLLLAVVITVGVTTDVALLRFKGLLRTVANDSAPSVELAGLIRESLAEMDADAVNGFLPGAPKEAFGEFGDHRNQAVNLLVRAAGNVTYGEAELVPIRALISGLTTYTGLVQTAHEMEYPGGIPIQFRASQLMTQQLLPAGEELDRANFKPLEASTDYAATHDFSLGLNISGWALVVLLAVVQIVVGVRFHRVINPALFAAFLLTLTLILYLDTRLADTKTLMTGAVDEAFASVHALSKAKALAGNANGDESLYILASGDRVSQALYEDSFKQKIGHLISTPITSRVRDQFATAIDRNEKAPYDGYVADALNNVTFPGEDKLALAMLDALKRYLEIDERVRELERSGQHAKAIELCLGDDPGQSNYAFAEFRNALDALSKLNQRVFEERMATAQLRLRNDEIGGTILVAIVALLSFVGLRPRIKEFA